MTCPGYQAKNPAESLARELVAVDLATARETGRLTLEPGTSLTGYSRDGKTLALLQGQPRSAKYPFPKSKVTFLDAASLTVTGTLDASGWSFVERDADRVYLIDRGQPDKNPEKNRNGAIDVVSLAERRAEHVEIGRSPTGALLIEGGLMAVCERGARRRDSRRAAVHPRRDPSPPPSTWRRSRASWRRSTGRSTWWARRR